MTLVRAFLLVLLGAWATACGGSRGAEPDEVQAHLEEVAVPLVDDSVNAFELAGDSAALERLANALEELDGSFGSLPFQLSAESDEWEGEGDSEEVDDPAEPTPGEEMASFLRERVFTDDNYEGDGVYRIDGDDVCEGASECIVSDLGDVDCEQAEPDPECVANVDSAQIRIEVLIVDGGVDVTLLIGPERSRPVKLESRDDRIAVVLDLGESKEAIEWLADIAEEEVELPDVLEGVVAFTLQRNGEEDYTVEVGIREAVEVSGSSDEGDFVFRAAARDPALAIRIDAAGHRLIVDLDAPATYAELPLSMLDDESAADGTLRIDWKGLSGSVVVDDEMESIVLQNLGLGDDTSTISLDDHELLSVDLNADYDRMFDLTIAPEGDSATFAFDPAFDLRITVDLSPLADAGDEIEPYLLGRTYEARFDGDAPTALPIAPADGSDGGLRIVSGELSLSASGADPVIVSAGSCLLGSEVADGEDPVLGALESGACP